MPSVLILNYEYPPIGGGAANALYYILREFGSEKNLKVDLVTSKAGRRLEVENLSANVTVHKLPIKKKSPHYWTQKEVFDYSLKALPFARRLSATVDYDLCHAFFALPCGWLAYRLRERLPYIVSLRGSDVPGFNQRFDKFNLALKPLFRRVLKAASAVQANSEGLRQLALRTSPGADIEVIFNGVDCRQFAPGPGLGRGSVPHLVTVCRLIGRKGVDDLVKALPLIKKKVGTVELTVVGEGNLMSDLKALAEENGVANLIKWLGYVEHEKLPQLYRQADLFVLPSYYEGMSNALLEAMASGLPVVVTDTGGTAELIRGNGVVVEAANPPAQAEAVAKILLDKELGRDYGERSRELAITFSWQNVAKRYLSIYERVANAGS